MNVRDVLKKLNIKITSENSSGYAQFCPKYRNSKDPIGASVNLKTGKVTDWSNNETFSINELINRCQGNFSVKLEAKLEEDFPMPRKTWKKEVLNRLIPNHSYWLNRGISKETLVFFKGGVAHSGKLYQRYVWPCFNKYGQIIGFSGRDITDEKEIKYKHLGSSKDFIFGVYNEDENFCRPILNTILEKKEVIITEGPSDSVACFDEGVKNVVPSFGLSISKTLLSFLSACVDKIIICYNMDKNFRGQDATVKQYSKLINSFPPDRLIIHFPTNNDLCDNKQKISQWYKAVPKVADFVLTKKLFEDKFDRNMKEGKSPTNEEKKAYNTIKSYVS